MEINESKIKALIALLDDEDVEVINHVNHEILNLGEEIIPFLEQEWNNSAMYPKMQKRIEDLIHQVNFNTIRIKLLKWKLEGSVDIIEAMWLIACYQYPDLSLSDITASINQIYYEVWPEMKEGLTPVEQVNILNHVLFNKLKFGANSKNFHAPSNSMLNAVLESKKGNPISLCVIYYAVASKLGLPIYGVNLPNLFILTYKGENTQFYINAFNKGIIFTKSDIDNYIAQLNITPQPLFYEPCTHNDIVVRVIRNLTVSFEKLGDQERAAEMNQLLAVFE
jgi:regulator of sirC expression with transglutaminase-like and TPR domain